MDEPRHFVLNKTCNSLVPRAAKFVHLMIDGSAESLVILQI